MADAKEKIGPNGFHDRSRPPGKDALTVVRALFGYLGLQPAG